jgi:hypothetical protein
VRIATEPARPKDVKIALNDHNGRVHLDIRNLLGFSTILLHVAKRSRISRDCFADPGTDLTAKNPAPIMPGYHRNEGLDGLVFSCIWKL